MVDSSSFMDGVQGFMKKFTTKATASHILIKGGAEAANKLDDIKLDLMGNTNTDDDEDDTTYSASTLLSKFSQAASKYSDCPSASKGGSLGSFRPGQMVKEFDTVVFNEPIGTIHGPIQTQFGYHLIYIQSRSDWNEMKKMNEWRKRIWKIVLYSNLYYFIGHIVNCKFITINIYIKLFKRSLLFVLGGILF